ncbi:fels-2 prophage Pin, partial [Escherichia coli 6.0172]
RSP